MKFSSLVFSMLLIISLTLGCNLGNKTLKFDKTTLNGHKYALAKDEPGDNLKEGDYAYFNYVVRLKDSVIFNSSLQGPITKFKFPKIEKVEPKNSQPIIEVLQFMSKGDSAIVKHILDETMKTSLNIPNAEELEYDVILVDIKSEEEYKKDQEADNAAKTAAQQAALAKMPEIEAKIKQIFSDFKSGKLNSKVKTLASGLKYIIHEAGNGPIPQKGQTVVAHYYGMLLSDGTRFDDSYSRGQEFSFPLGSGNVIKGWDEGFANIPVGSKASLIIPYALAYGEAGNPPVIPAKADLMFYVELNQAK
ncbi:MAG: FKBP-type peptidyl-prolyl cis-trans isomerase [Bacteroidota bacterium]|nr:FKBP-type peptidyl-prolyl cis-trans isomerase [Bacteroidota bacterium]